jgi:hypothetical protein
MLCRLIPFTLLQEGSTEAFMNLGILRLDLDGLSKILNRSVQSAPSRQHLPELEQSLCIVGISIYCLLKENFRVA